MSPERRRRANRAASAEAALTPCVVCGAEPSVGHAYGYVQGENGRVCEEHADAGREAGTMVALDDGGVHNVGRDQHGVRR